MTLNATLLFRRCLRLEAFPIVIFLAMCRSGAFGAAVTTIAVDTGTAILENGSGFPLSAGNLLVNHDGFVVQLGYHSNATVGHEFDGGWIPLTGQGSANTAFAHSTIGDDPQNGARDGEFVDEWSFVVGSASAGQNLPSAGTPLAFRFYAGIHTFNSMFGEVSNSLWLWPEPQEPATAPLFLEFNAPGLKKASGAAIPGNLRIRTDTDPPLIPEPATFLVATAGILTLLAQRRPCVR